MTRSRGRRLGRVDRRSASFSRRALAGNFLIVTDGEYTEFNYIDGLAARLRSQGKSIGIKKKVCRTPKLVDTCIRIMNESEQVMDPWIVFDRDQVSNFDGIIREAEANGIHAAWSNPCFEIWFLAYFQGIPNVQTSTECVRAFGTKYKSLTGRDYIKNIPDIYSFLTDNGDEEQALRRADQKRKQLIRQVREVRQRDPGPSELCPCTMVDVLVSHMRND